MNPDCLSEGDIEIEAIIFQQASNFKIRKF